MRASSGYARVATIRPLCCAAAHPPPPPPPPLPPQHNHTTTNTPHFIRSIAHSTPPNHPCLPLRYSTAMPQQLLHKRSRAATVGPASSKRARSSQLSPTATLSLSPIQLSDEGLDQPEPADELSTTSDSSHHSSSSSSSSTPPPLPTLPKLGAVRSSPSLAATAAAAALPFNGDECRSSPFPIFRDRHIIVRPPVDDKTDDELKQLTFIQYLDYFLVHRQFASERRYMISDERYCHLLGFITSSHKHVSDYGREKELDEAQVAALQHALCENTFKYQLAEYAGASVSDIEKGTVLVCFREPRLAAGEKDKRPSASSSTECSRGMARTCVPYSMINRVLTHVHAGELGRTMHLGQQATWERFNSLYDGVSRELVRMFVKKCKACSSTVKRVHKAPLVRITARTLFERVVIDLIDFERKPSHGFRYIFHAMDHFSKYHWAWAMVDKSATSVAFFMSALLADIGPITFVQCDQGKEFIAEVLRVAEEFSSKVVNSSPYHPQTNGLVERGNGVMKAAINIWFIQEQSEDWYPPLARIRYQLNCNKPRTTKFTPYELLYSKKPPAWEGPPALNAASLDYVLNGPADSAPELTAQPTDTAATILTTLAIGATPPASLPVQPPSLPNSQLPLVSSLLPDTEPTIYQQFVLNCCAGQPGALNRYMADQLNVGCHFMRLGGEGGGRCAISAFYNCISPMRFINLSSADRRKAYDNIRKQLRALWVKLSADKDKATVAKQQRLQRMIFELGNSGSSPGDAVQRATSPAAAWAQLGEDLTLTTKALGWDALALMATERRVNLLLFLCLETSHDYHHGTQKAAQYWAEADADGKAAQLALTGRTRPGGRWLHLEGGTSERLVPAYAVVDRP